ncbi:hypothetical protein PIB30_033830 [Stylosanthes scabra]|uniref:Pentatricopeptide repeat-containing protein n=1 Tax=Stylosanthes scabra TaxID=79078 RepID=A0ABU6ZB47_9FABA|nr:hypothetical protein [Stylosanthes scabra]
MSLRCLIGYIFLRRKLPSGQGCFLRLYNSASSALVLEDQVFDESPKPEPNAVVDFGVTRSVPRVPTTGSELFPLVTKVFKSLNFRVAREKRFGSWVQSHGFSHSIICFRIIIHIFALAGMPLEVFTLLRDIVEYCNESEHDTFELFSALVDSPHHAERSAVVLDVLMKVFASNSKLENALDVFVNAKHIGLEPDIKSCNFLLKCMVEANRVDFVRLFFEELKDSGPSPNIYTYTIMMNFYCRGGPGWDVNIRRATEILGKIFSSGQRPTVVTYSSYIHGLCKVGSLDVALKLICNLSYRNKALNSHCFNAVLRGFCTRGAVHEAFKVLEEMKNSGVMPDAYSYSILIDALCKKGYVEKSLYLMKEMERFQIKPSVVSYTSLIHGLCKAGHLEESLTLLEELSDLGITLNSHSYNAIMYKLCKEGYPERALEILPRMLKRNALPGVVNYSTLISGFAKQFNFRKSVMLFKRMVKAGITFNIITYTILINIFSHTGKMHGAYAIFNEMKERGLCPDLIAYTSLIAGFCNAEELKKAWAIFEEMSREGCFPSVITYTCLIDRFCKSNRIDLASWLFDKMNRDAVSPDVVTYTVLIAWYCKHGLKDQAHNLYSEMIGKGILPDDRIRPCAKVDVWAVKRIKFRKSNGQEHEFTTVAQMQLNGSCNHNKYGGADLAGGMII